MLIMIKLNNIMKTNILELCSLFLFHSMILFRFFEDNTNNRFLLLLSFSCRFTIYPYTSFIMSIVLLFIIMNIAMRTFNLGLDYLFLFSFRRCKHRRSTNKWWFIIRVSKVSFHLNRWYIWKVTCFIQYWISTWLFILNQKILYELLFLFW
jgi:hypothetical protein